MGSSRALLWISVSCFVRKLDVASPSGGGRFCAEMDEEESLFQVGKKGVGGDILRDE